MKKSLIIIWFCYFSVYLNSQSLYFPPTTGNQWDTLAPSSLGWCQPRIDNLYNYLELTDTKGFIALKDGKIVLEKYFGTFVQDSIWYWASCGKSLTATLVGIAQQEGLMNIDSSASNYLGNGWTSTSPVQEDSITIKHLLTMTSGLDDGPPLPCTNTDTATSCLIYLADAGTRWAYHTGAYRRLEEAVANSSGISYNAFCSTRLGSHIGMTGLWFGGVYYSKARDMARFGLLTLNRGIWDNDTVLQDTNYYNAMVNTSQSFNQSYGYLWWLNGKPSFMVPGLQVVFPSSLIPNAPNDMFAALGKNDQKIYIVPSENMVYVRIGNPAGASQLAVSLYDNDLWGKIDSLDYCPLGMNEPESLDTEIDIYPNPANNYFNIKAPVNEFSLSVYSLSGIKILSTKTANKNAAFDCSGLTPGIYLVEVISGEETWTKKLVIQP